MSSHPTITPGSRVVVNPAILDEKREAGFDQVIVEHHHYHPKEEPLWRQIAVKGTAEIIALLIVAILTAALSAFFTLATPNPTTSMPKTTPPSALAITHSERS